MIHHMKLKPIPFHQMKGGAKTIELQLYDPKRQQIKIGDQIEFTNTQDMLFLLYPFHFSLLTLKQKTRVVKPFG